MQDTPLFTPPRRSGPTAAATRSVFERPGSQPHPSLDQPLIAILEAPLRDGETAANGFDRKERELAAAIADLTILAAYALRKRLANPVPSDVLAQTFVTRLTIERRNRLLVFLDGARRRAALAGGAR